jgi:hypothetical protein
MFNLLLANKKDDVAKNDLFLLRDFIH